MASSISSKVDNISVSGDSSNSRNSISKTFDELLRGENYNFTIILVTTDSQTSEEDSVPPLPPKHRDCGNLPEESHYGIVKSIGGSVEECYQEVSHPSKLAPVTKIVSNVHYEMLEIRTRDVNLSDESKAQKKNPPTPPPKPHRASKGSLSP